MPRSAAALNQGVASTMNRSLARFSGSQPDAGGEKGKPGCAYALRSPNTFLGLAFGDGLLDRASVNQRCFVTARQFRSGTGRSA
jgi:hypothetical protein